MMLKGMVRTAPLLPLALALLVAGAVASAGPGQRAETFTGIIADGECGGAGHDAMRMGPTDAECTAACVDAHGAPFVLVVDGAVYALSDQKTPGPLAGRKVVVVGTLDAATRTIAVETIAAAR